MASLDKGAVCLKNSGREKGKKCIVMGAIDDKYVEVVCAGRKKRRKCNRRDLTPTGETVDVGSDEEALKALA